MFGEISLYRYSMVSIDGQLSVLSLAMRLASLIKQYFLLYVVKEAYLTCLQASSLSLRIRISVFFICDATET